jgi:hypothetical protein
VSVRNIHKRVDRSLDTVFFRKRHEDERAIRSFGHEAAYITDAGLLLPRTKSLLEKHADALDTVLQGEFAYPMVARGHLVGAIVVGPKCSGDPYAPDESEAILHLAHGVGGALDVLSANGHASSDGLLEAIETMSGDLRSLTAEIRAALQRQPDWS